MTSKAVIYSSLTGKTRKTGQYLAEKLGADSFDLKKQTLIDMSEYSHIIFGTGMHFGKPYKALLEFAEANRPALAKKRVSLFACCKIGDKKGADQCKAAADAVGAAEWAFFCGKGDKNPDGFEVALDDFVGRMR
ncbi:MAG: flavodoxin domain-containing protein [Candidatus Methanoplasma sp.]|jgi:menaquinone-dependent protoporphyrinogen oxidase|nr:flavodoxin domain-containing protein [Candidatus Methanoplasma sp.]